MLGAGIDAYRSLGTCRATGGVATPEDGSTCPALVEVAAATLGSLQSED